MSIYFSIHSPLAGRDNTCCHVWLVAGFSIHSPLAGRDFTGVKASILACKFQSTRPLRSETEGGRPMTRAWWFFNPLAPCGARPLGSSDGGTLEAFQSTRPLRSETAHAGGNGRGLCVFNPLAPCGARRNASFGFSCPATFSIHSPLAGRDVFQSVVPSC